MPDQTNVITRNISIYPDQDAFLLKIADDNGLNSISAAVRWLINDWKKLQSVTAATPAPEYPAD